MTFPESAEYLTCLVCMQGSGFPQQQLAITALILNNMKIKQTAPTPDSADGQCFESRLNNP